MSARARLLGALRVGAVAASLLLAAGCGDGAKSKLDTAELEEQQHNLKHAKQLYAEIVKEHPGTPEAATAAARLEALGLEEGVPQEEH